MPRDKKQNENNKLISFTLLLPASLSKLLEERGGSRGRAEEARRLMQVGIDAEAAPAETRELLALIREVADQVDGYIGPWSKTAYAFAAFKTAVVAALETHPPPPSDAMPKFAPGSASADDRPETVGRILAGLALRKRLLS